MRLDHLLSREPVNWGRALSCLVGCVFLVPALRRYRWVVGVGAFFGLGIGTMASMLSGSRSTPVGR